jgi:hypothetical protein
MSSGISTAKSFLLSMFSPPFRCVIYAGMPTVD